MPFLYDMFSWLSNHLLQQLKEGRDWPTIACGSNLADSSFWNKLLLELSHVCLYTYCPWLLLHYDDRVKLLQQGP